MSIPDLADFGITPAEYQLYAEGKLDERTHKQVLHGTFGITFVGLGLLAFRLTGWTEDTFCMVVMAAGVGFCAAMRAEEKAVEIKRRRLVESDVGQRIEQYEKAVREYQRVQWEAERAKAVAEQIRRENERKRQRIERVQQRVQENYWVGLSGVEFELAVGELFRDAGYYVALTPYSGDEGVDLEIHKDSKVYVVQCKQQRRSATPAIARELLGSKVAFHADGAVLVCTGGFSRRTREFAQRNAIWLVSVHDLTQLALEARLSQVPGNTAPFCPRCRESMVLRDGAYGKFWGCPKFPDCWGTRDY